MGTHVRHATHSDVEFLAWVMLSASRGHLQRGVWDLLVGGGDGTCLDYLRRLAVAEPRSLCHYNSYLVAEEDGRPVSALCGFDPRDGGWATVAQAMTAVQRDLGWTDGDLAASMQRAAPAWTCFLPDIGADWAIENVATLPAYRRRGLAMNLLNEVVQEGMRRGCQLAQITSLIGNDTAQRAYERIGFRVRDEKRTAEFRAALGAAGYVRLTRQISR
jgi:ribosomal protein S18 acetylase RimI-like enzyme